MSQTIQATYNGCVRNITRNLKIFLSFSTASSLLTAALVLTLTLALAITGSAQVFYDDFDMNPAGAGSGLEGHQANTGQVWGDGHFGVEGQPHILDVASGQGGTLGAGKADGQNKYNSVPLNLDLNSTEPTITGGTIFVDVDFHRTDASGEIQVGLSDLPPLGTIAAHGPNFIWHSFASCETNGGTAPCLEIQGIASSTFVPVQFGTGNMHAQMEANLDNNTGTLRWFDLDDPTNPARSGEAPLPFNRPGNPTGGNWAINALWLANSAGNGSGVDNLCVGTAGECVAFEPPPPATAFEWTSADSGDWNTGGNWNPLNGTAGSRPPGNQSALQSSEHTATFGDAIGSASRTVFTDTAVTVNSISFTNTMGGNYRIAGGPSINMNTSTTGVPPSLVASAGSHQFQVPFAIHANTTANIASGATLTFNNSLDLKGNSFTKTGDGTLAINNVLTTGEGAVVNQQGTLSGVGTIEGDVINGGTLSPGSSADTHSVVPEPTTMFLALVGLAGLLGLLSRRT